MGDDSRDATDPEGLRALPNVAQLLHQASSNYISPAILELYSVWDYRHAGAILKTEFPNELADLQAALLHFRFTDEQVRKGGGNESDMPK